MPDLIPFSTSPDTKRQIKTIANNAIEQATHGHFSMFYDLLDDTKPYDYYRTTELGDCYTVIILKNESKYKDLLPYGVHHEKQIQEILKLLEE